MVYLICIRFTIFLKKGKQIRKQMLPITKPIIPPKIIINNPTTVKVDTVEKRMVIVIPAKYPQNDIIINAVNNGCAIALCTVCSNVCFNDVFVLFIKLSFFLYFSKVLCVPLIHLLYTIIYNLSIIISKICYLFRNIFILIGY